MSSSNYVIQLALLAQEAPAQPVSLVWHLIIYYRTLVFSPVARENGEILLIGLVIIVPPPALNVTPCQDFALHAQFPIFSQTGGFAPQTVAMENMGTLRIEFASLVIQVAIFALEAQTLSAQIVLCQIIFLEPLALRTVAQGNSKMIQT